MGNAHAPRPACFSRISPRTPFPPPSRSEITSTRTSLHPSLFMLLTPLPMPSTQLLMTTSLDTHADTRKLANMYFPFSHRRTKLDGETAQGRHTHARTIASISICVQVDARQGLLYDVDSGASIYPQRVGEGNAHQTRIIGNAHELHPGARPDVCRICCAS